MKKSTKTWLHLFLGLAVFVLTGWLLYRNLHLIDMNSLWKGFRQIKLSALLGASLTMLLVLVFTAWMWKLFLPADQPVGFFKILEIISLWSLGTNTLPLLSGHPLAIYLLVNRGKTTKTTAFSVLSLDQLMEGIGRLPVFAVVAIATPLPAWMSHGMEVILGIVIVAFSLFVFLAHYYRDPFRARKKFKKPWLDRLYHHFSNWAQQLHALRDGKKLLGSLALAIAMKLIMVLPIYWVQRGFGLALPIWTPFLILSALYLTTMVPITPGNVGIFEATVFLIYTQLGIDPAQALVLGLFHHLVYLLPLIVPGYLFSLKNGWKKSRVIFKKNGLDWSSDNTKTS